MELRSDKYGIHAELKDFSQAQLEIYQPLVIVASRNNYFAFDDKGRGLTAEAVVQGATIRAAITAGFLTGITQKEADELTPKAAFWLVKKIREHVNEVTKPDDDPN